MIRQPPRSTRLTHAVPTRRSSDLTGLGGQMPMQIGKYELGEEIGRGACGVVYKGFDPFVQREVALKFSLHTPELRNDTAHERAFFAEARAAGMLQHPHIVGLHDAGVEEIGRASWRERGCQ